MSFTQGIQTINRLAADFPVTSNATPADITGFTFAVGSLKRIKFRFRCVFTLGASGGFRFVAHNTHAPAIYNAEFNVAEGTTPQDFNNAIFAEAAFTNASAHAATYFAHIEGEIEQDATGGTFSIQFAQNTSDAATATIKAGATLEIWQL